MPAFALRIAIYGVIVPLAFVVVVPHSFEVIQWWLTPSPVPANTTLIPQTAEHVPDSPPAQIALPPLPSVHELLAEAERLQDLFDQGRMHELYANFSDEAKAQVPEAVFVAQANEVLEQLGPRKPDGWNDADRLSTFLNGPSKGRQALLWKLHPETLKFDVGSVRYGSLADSSEDLVLDLSGGQVKLAMFSEFKERSPAASIRLPQTCSHKGEDPLQHCTVPGAPVIAHDAIAIPAPVIAHHAIAIPAPVIAHHAIAIPALAIAHDAIAIPTPGHTWVSTALAIDPEGHAVIAAVGREGWLEIAICRTKPCRPDAVTTTTRAMSLIGPVALAIGSDGLAMAAVSRGEGRSSSTILLVHCDDRACSRISSTAVATGKALGLAMGLDGFPIIIYSVFDERTLTTQLRLAMCRDAACTSPSMLTAVGPINTFDSGDPSIAVGRDGRAMIAFAGPGRANGSDASLFFAHCADRMCSAMTVRELVIKADTVTSRVATLPTMATSGGGPNLRAVVLRAGSQGLPVIGYTMEMDGEIVLRIMHCVDSDCAGVRETHTVSRVDNNISLAAELDSEDRPVFAPIVYEGKAVYPKIPAGNDPPPPDYETFVALLHCATPTCRPIAKKVLLGSIGIGRIGDSQLALRPDGTLVAIAFEPHRSAVLLWDATLAH
ncbi:hypothetical protein B0E51_14100 [Rhodanobacter sp. C05]|nr:hypothetical protein B0E51_14100 [Rhodanobacter sp. C05]